MSLLRVENVTKHFGSLVAVDNVSMTVEPGELRAVIGPNGAGKTTFFNTDQRLPHANVRQDPVRRRGYLRVAAGAARLARHRAHLPDHRSVSRADGAREPAHRRRGGGGYRLRPWLSPTPTKKSRRASTDLLEMGGLADKADRLVGELSHGDQRATEIMMALALKPRLLLLDEPTAGMGDQETYDITQLIRKLHRDQKLTIVLIEHDMRVVFHLADRIMVLAEGKMLAEGTPKEIAANEAVQAAYLGKAAA